MTLDEMQLAVDTWIKTHGRGYRERFEILACLTEELGEVSAALQRDQGLRPRKTIVDLASEVGDLLFTIAAFANLSGIQLDEAIQRTLARDAPAWAEYSQEERP